MLTEGSAFGTRTGEHRGWYLLAFAEELHDELTPLRIGSRALIAVQRDGQTRVFDATCPHRGAHLGYGGRLTRGGVVCPFHGRLIQLGHAAGGRYCVREHQVARFGSVIFVRLSNTPADDRGFLDAMQSISAGRRIVGGMVVPVAVPAELVTENAFDADHFSSVHGVPRVIDMQVRRGAQREITIEGAFETRQPPWEGQTEGMFRTRFLARAFSPTLVVTELGASERSHVVITGALPSPDGCVARVAYGVAAGAARSAALDPLIEGGRKAFDQDVAVWEHLNRDVVEQWDDRDRSVRAFREFCAEFEVAG